jgi:hypothetical protein
LNILIKNKFGFDLKFTEKKMTHFLDILDEHIIESDEEESPYDIQKKEFEINNFKILDPISFATIRDDKTLILRSKADLITTYENIIYNSKNKDGEDEEKQFIKKWLLDGNNKTYDRIDFLPMQQAPPNIYNTFKGYEAEKIDLQNIDIENSYIMKHLKTVMCNNDENVYNYIIKYFSNLLQHPNKKANTALIFKSIQGAGKDTILNWFGNNILGNEYYINTESADLIFGRFNSNISNKILVVLNEASGKDTYTINEKIKNAITRDINEIECKGKETYKNTNNIGYIFLTNNDNPVKVPHDDRRFTGIECNGDLANNKEYFTALYEEIKSKKYDRAFYNYFMSVDISNYDFTNNRPITDFYNNMKETNLPIIAKFFENIIDNNSNQKEIKYKASELFIMFNEYVKGNNYKVDYTSTKFGIDIKMYKGIEKKKLKTHSEIKIDIKLLRHYLIEKYKIEFNNENDFIDDKDDKDELNKNSSLNIISNKNSNDGKIYKNINNMY